MNFEQAVEYIKRIGIKLSWLVPGESIAGTDSCPSDSVPIPESYLPDGVSACLKKLPDGSVHPILGEIDSALIVNPNLEIFNTTSKVCDSTVARIPDATNSVCNGQALPDTLQFFINNGNVLVESVNSGAIKIPLDIFLRKFGYAVQETMSTSLPELVSDFYEYFISTGMQYLCGSVVLLGAVILISEIISSEEDNSKNN